jgi:hypothetical protein
MFPSDKVDAKRNDKKWTSKVELADKKLDVDSEDSITIGTGKAKSISIGQSKTGIDIMGSEVVMYVGSGTAEINAKQVLLG